jgi:hypothetical protein
MVRKLVAGRGGEFLAEGYFDVDGRKCYWSEWESGPMHVLQLFLYREPKGKVFIATCTAGDEFGELREAFMAVGRSMRVMK